MTEFSKTINSFFRSNAKSFSEYKELLTENQLQADWLNAVALYRKGVLALQKNDLSGIEEIKKANTELKKIVSIKNGEKAEIALNALTESINTDINLDLIKYNFGQLYSICKQSGLKQVINENSFYEEDGDGDSGETSGNSGETSGDNVTQNTESPIVTEETPVDNTMDQSAPIEPEPVSNTETTSTPVTNTTDPSMPSQMEEKCGFEEGFEEGKKWVMARESKFGCMTEMKNALQEKISSNLHQKPYSFVEQYKEGFKEGCMYQEKVHQRKFIKEWNKYQESQSV